MVKVVVAVDSGNDTTRHEVTAVWYFGLVPYKKNPAVRRLLKRGSLRSFREWIENANRVLESEGYYDLNAVEPEIFLNVRLTMAA